MNKKLKKNKIPALVFGSSITALGTIRSLGREGIPTFYVNPKPDFVKYSRWAKLLLTEAIQTKDYIGIEDFLSKITYEQAVLYPCTDSYAKECANLSPELANRFASTVPSKLVIDMMLDKKKFAEILTVYNIPHPQTIYLKNEQSINVISPDRLTPYFIKPTNSQHFFKQFGVKAFKFSSLTKFKEQYERLTQEGYELLLQEYIPGPANQHYYIDGYVSKTREKRTFFARRRLRMYPADFGNSTLLKSIPIHQVKPAAESLDYLFSEIKFNGIFSAEFKWDERDNTYKILEINARPWWYIEYASRCGVNVCKLAYDDVLGIETIPNTAYRINSYLAYPYYDYCTLFEVTKKSKFTIFQYVFTWLKSQTPFFTINDPMPGIVTLYLRIKYYLLRRLFPPKKIDNKPKPVIHSKSK